ncbi:hypothetical protein OG871_09750 [Kitasatospora sp. NBC_00374]
MSVPKCLSIPNCLSAACGLVLALGPMRTERDRPQEARPGVAG